MINNIVLERLKKNKYLARFATPEFIGKFSRYIVTGICSAVIEFTLLFVLRDIAGLSVIVANSIALAIVFWFNFLMNRFWSFKSKSNLKKQLILYLILFVFILGASDVIMYLLTEKLLLQYLVAKVFAIGAVVSWNFVLYNKVIYR